MLRKSAAILVCAAGVTFVAAQLPWEISPTESSSDESSSYGSSDESSFSGFESYSSEEEPAPAVEETAVEERADADAKPKRERAPKAAVAGFNSQKSCPVCNSAKIKKNLYVEHNGQRIHVNSASCIGRVKRNPEAFVKVLEKRGEKPES